MVMDYPILHASEKHPFTGNLNDAGGEAGVDQWSDWGYKNFDSNFNSDIVNPNQSTLGAWYKYPLQTILFKTL